MCGGKIVEKETCDFQSRVGPLELLSRGQAIASLVGSEFCVQGNDWRRSIRACDIEKVECNRTSSFRLSVGSERIVFRAECREDAEAWAWSLACARRRSMPMGCGSDDEDQGTSVLAYSDLAAADAPERQGPAVCIEDVSREELGLVLRETVDGLCVAAVARCCRVDDAGVKPVTFRLDRIGGTKCRTREDVETALARSGKRIELMFSSRGEKSESNLDFSYDCFDVDSLVVLDPRVGTPHKGVIPKPRAAMQKVSLRKMMSYCRWLNSTGIWTLDLSVRNIHEQLKDGLLLCRLMQTLVQGTKYERLHRKPRTKATKIANLEQALGVIWRSKRVNHSAIATAYEIYEARPKDAINRTIAEVFQVYVMKDVRIRAKKTLHWFEGFVGPMTEVYSKHNFAGVWDAFADGTKLACVLDRFVDGSGLSSMTKPQLVREVFAILAKLDVPCYWTPEDWATFPDDDLALAQLDVIRHRLKHAPSSATSILDTAASDESSSSSLRIDYSGDHNPSPTPLPLGPSEEAQIRETEQVSEAPLQRPLGAVYRWFERSKAAMAQKERTLVRRLALLRSSEDPSSADYRATLTEKKQQEAELRSEKRNLEARVRRETCTTGPLRTRIGTSTGTFSNKRGNKLECGSVKSQASVVDRHLINVSQVSRAQTDGFTAADCLQTQLSKNDLHCLQYSVASRQMRTQLHARTLSNEAQDDRCKSCTDAALAGLLERRRLPLVERNSERPFVFCVAEAAAFDNDYAPLDRALAWTAEDGRQEGFVRFVDLLQVTCPKPNLLLFLLKPYRPKAVQNTKGLTKFALRFEHASDCHMLHSAFATLLDQAS